MNTYLQTQDFSIILPEISPHISYDSSFTKLEKQYESSTNKRYNKSRNLVLSESFLVNEDSLIQVSRETLDTMELNKIYYSFVDNIVYDMHECNCLLKTSEDTIILFKICQDLKTHHFLMVQQQSWFRVKYTSKTTYLRYIGFHEVCDNCYMRHDYVINSLSDATLHDINNSYGKMYSILYNNKLKKFFENVVSVQQIYGSYMGSENDMYFFGRDIKNSYV